MAKFGNASDPHKTCFQEISGKGCAAIGKGVPVIPVISYDQDLGPLTHTNPGQAIQ